VVAEAQHQEDKIALESCCGPPMTLSNMWAQGVRSLWVVGDLCHHDAVVNVDRFGEDVPVPAFGWSAHAAGSSAPPSGQTGKSGRSVRA
jgi:hypothetical protein